MYLQPDKPTHLLTEILWRLKPKSEIGKRDWIGLIKNGPGPDRINELAEEMQMYVFSCNNRHLYVENFLPILENWRKKNADEGKALVDLKEEYTKKHVEDLTQKVRENWLFGEESSHNNVFFIVDIAESEQLAGIDMELQLPPEVTKKTLDEVDKLLHDCQWMVSQYIVGLVSRVEKVHSVSGGLYRDMYFYKEMEDTEVKREFTYPMIDNLCKFLNTETYSERTFSKWPFIKLLFRKLRTHFEVVGGQRGNYCLGYRNHAYEVVCTVAGVMDVLFEFGESPSKGEDGKPLRPNSIEDIVRQSGPYLTQIQDKLKEKTEIPFLFRQLFRGLSAENQLFVIPMYREHFIHSFYTFVFGLILMCRPPHNTIPRSLRIIGKGKHQSRELLKEWFMVSMWHDIAYILQKGSSVLEQYVLRFMQGKIRYKGLLP